MEAIGKVLVCGASSFVAHGIVKELQGAGYVVDCFSRGEEGRSGNVVKGNYLSISAHQYLAPKYDIVVNYSVIKDGSVEDNLMYIRSLVELCSQKGVKKLIHFSSMMVYGYHEGRVTEETPIESLETTWKRGYGEFKIACDQYLISVRESLSYEVVLVRPGYVLADNRQCPFIKPLPLGLTLIKGDSKSKQPIVQRQDIHKAILRIIETDNNLPVYNFFPNNGMTKYRFAKEQGYKHLIPMPKLIFKWLPWALMKVGVMKKAMYSRFDGMYNESEFSSEKTEKKLNIQFT